MRSRKRYNFKPAVEIRLAPIWVPTSSPKSDEKVLDSIEKLTGTKSDTYWYSADETNKKIDLLIQGYNDLITILKDRKIIKDS